MTSFTSGVTLSMSPEQLDFIGETGERICDTATIKTDGIKTVTGKVMFSEEGFNERKLTRHNLTPDERGVSVTFPHEIVIDNEKQIEVCLSAPYGDYHGIILYKIKDAPIQVGIWINASFGGGESVSIIHMAGLQLEEVDALDLLGVTGIVWMIVLGGLLVVWRLSEKKKQGGKFDSQIKSGIEQDKTGGSKIKESEFMDY